MSFKLLFDAAMAERIALTLIHFLWQGTLIALVVLLAGAFLARTASDRYGWSGVGLVLMALSPIVTLAWLIWLPRPETDAPIQEPRPHSALHVGPGWVPSVSSEPRDSAPWPRDVLAWDFVPWNSDRSEGSAAASSVVETPGLAPRPEVFGRQSSATLGGESPVHLVPPSVPATRIRPPRLSWSHLVLSVWLAGVSVFATRMLLGVMALRWIKLNCRSAAASTSRAVGRLSARMGIQPPRVGVSERVTQAMVTGILRPMVILPTAWVTQLRPDFLEAVLSHELAHLRRRDLWTIYVQRLTETVLFFHPAVWWLSSRLQQEREWCCDALAVRVTGEPMVYACALERVASWQRELCMPSLAAGMNGGKKMLLLRRIEHVLGIPTPKAEFQPAGLLLASLMLAAGFVWVAGSGRPLMAEVGNGATQETEQERPVERKAGLAELPESLDAKATDDERGERKKIFVDGLVSPGEKREFGRQVWEWKQRIRDLIEAGQLEEARAAEEKLRRQVQEMAERGGDRPFPRQEEVLQRTRRIQQQLQEARQTGRLDVVERLERELEEVKRRARREADPVRGKLAELQQRMNVAIKSGRPDEVIELGHQIAEVMHSSFRDQPAHPDDDPFRPRPGAGRPDDRPLGARPGARSPDDGANRLFRNQGDGTFVPRPDGPTPRDGARFRPDGPDPAAPRELLEVVRQLREEVGQLRRDVNELRGERGEERR